MYKRQLQERWNWYVDLGLDPENMRFLEHPQEKLSHYSKRTVDIEYRFNFTGSEWGELEGIANRTDFDLSSHSQHSGQDPVSYTHLDVYKRQTKARTAMRMSFSGAARRGQVRKINQPRKAAMTSVKRNPTLGTRIPATMRARTPMKAAHRGTRLRCV